MGYIVRRCGVGKGVEKPYFGDSTRSLVFTVGSDHSGWLEELLCTANCN